MPKTVLLIIDAQNEMFDPANPVHQSEQLLENLQSLIKKARSADVSIIYVQHNDAGLVEGTDFWQIHPSITPQEGDAVIQKWTPDSFHENELLEILQKNGVHNLVIAGNQTEHCINATTRSASQLGFEVTLAKDAHGTWDSKTMSAQEIIDHQNGLLSGFVTLQETKDIEFTG
ncbi:cysteine hydrolase [Planococcus sp. CP5-4]|uniref:cysteine hydrolase family protein n=1 Tax=unclassified Planococcus (in: firmicutes) TaxID=2662419 RepID=UPI001C236B08|nr:MULTISPECIES: cysteine hydrolase family protein [unclassified Planococcus (in: firmicutes)]MBU9671835.1 cysteine hydrolase [Planococcus sp. CP5-4_YE]MBV0909155.1 cysteine hydrolase [Planococcus sp. CP5-4_UN]MBW6063647.1 cysteine hydrolase [Planococcus sp. CP5-4]